MIVTTLAPLTNQEKEMMEDGERLQRLETIHRLLVDEHDLQAKAVGEIHRQIKKKEEELGELEAASFEAEAALDSLHASLVGIEDVAPNLNHEEYFLP